MKKTRVVFLVSANLDPVPGTFDRAEDFALTLKEWGDRFPWYRPVVTFLGERDASPTEAEAWQREAS